jgi:hypothetical protein
MQTENEYLKNQINKIIEFNDNLIKQNIKNEAEISELKNKIIKFTSNTKSKEFNVINDNIKKLEKTIPTNSGLEISNQLVNKIIEKEKIIDDLGNKLDIANELIDSDNKQKIKNKYIIIDDIIDKNNKTNKINKTNKSDELDESEQFKNKLELIENESMNLVLNNEIIQYRNSDNYINATQLCKAGCKKFNDWLRLDSTKNIINILSSKAGIPALDLIDSKKGGNHMGSWIHPDLAIQLAQWLSPEFSIHISLWIKELFGKENFSFNLKILKEKENIIKDNLKRIKILEDLTLKRHRRTKYPESNVVYIITDKNNKKNRTYIIGSTIDLTDRLSIYNKGIENEVIYYKGFETEEIMKKAEQMVLMKLKKYQEKANRDRFILPIGKDIKLFTNVIDDALNFFK